MSQLTRLLKPPHWYLYIGALSVPAVVSVVTAAVVFLHEVVVHAEQVADLVSQRLKRRPLVKSRMFGQFCPMMERNMLLKPLC